MPKSLSTASRSASSTPLNHQRGFGVAALLGVLALFAVAAAAALYGSSSSSSNVSEAKASAAASALNRQLAMYKDAFAVAASRNVAPASITWDDAAGTGLFNRDVGNVVEELAPPDAADSGMAGNWRLSRVALAGVGTTASDIVLVAPTNPAVCRAYSLATRGTATPASTAATTQDVLTPDTVTEAQTASVGTGSYFCLTTSGPGASVYGTNLLVALIEAQ